MSDFFDELEALPDKDFFQSLDDYEPWIPSQVGDRFSDYSDSYAIKNWVVIEVEPRTEGVHKNNITIVPDGAKPDKDGYYNVIGSTSPEGLMRSAKMGKLKQLR